MYRLYATSSGSKSSSTQISLIPGGLCGVDLQSPVSGQASLLLYDSDSSDTSNKNVLAELYADAGLAGLNHEFTNPVVVNQGIYAELTGTTTYIVRYLAG